MKISEKWLREWVNPQLTREQLVQKLTMAGLAVESCLPVNDDYVLEFELTPNRGDCLSVAGIAREIAALTDTAIHFPASKQIASNTQIDFPLEIHAPADAPNYIGRVISNISLQAVTPDWIQNYLTLSGVKIISPIVDIMNYVMLEIGQPLHAFDLNKLKDKIIIRRARNGEEITLLDEKKITLSNDVLVIADSERAHALAGIMGSLDSAVTETTTSIFIESAFFNPTIIAGRARRYGLHTDASHRFERGVDPQLARAAIERATELLLLVYGNSLHIGPCLEKQHSEYLPEYPKIRLRHQRIQQILGLALSHEDISAILKYIAKDIKRIDNDWLVQAPSYRFDLNEEIDLIEEIARLHGYEHIPTNHIALPLASTASSEKQLSLSTIKQTLMSQGYHEVITYSFIAEHWQQKIKSNHDALHLSNPLSAEYAVMRNSLWPGLLEVVQHNLNRQQNYLRFYETGLVFIQSQHELQQEMKLGGIWAGYANPEQWAEKKRDVDFFDIKNDVEQLFALSQQADKFIWQSAQHPALHPTQSAKILMNDEIVGWCGALHPQLQAKLDINVPVFLFEINLSALTQVKLPQYANFSKFPSIRRDLAFLVDTKTTISQIQQSIKSIAGSLLVDILIFDVYQGKNILAGKKSIALGLIFQLPDRTLIEDEVNDVVSRVIQQLELQFAAVLRE